VIRLDSPKRRIIRAAMVKKYFVDVYWFVCPKCKKQTVSKSYYCIFERAEIGAAKRSGLLTYHCTHCAASFSSKSITTNGEVSEVSREEAIAGGLAFESSGSA